MESKPRGILELVVCGVYEIFKGFDCSYFNTIEESKREPNIQNDTLNSISKTKANEKNELFIYPSKESKMELNTEHNNSQNKYNPRTISKVAQKVSDNKGDESLKESKKNSNSDLEESKSSLSISKTCYECKNSADLINLECKHYLCDPCLCNMVELECSKEKVYILKCECGKIIKSKIFQDIVLDSTLFEYLDHLNTYKLNNFKELECPVCGHYHKQQIKCSEYIRDIQNKKLCMGCESSEEFQLPCEHSYCNKCLKQLIIETWEQDPNSCVLCKFCESKRTVVPLFLLESCFGGSNNYQKKKKVYIDNMKAPNLECKVCFNVYKITNFITLECEHRFCSTCLVQFIEDHICSMKTNQIECPDCRAEISQAIIKGNIRAGLYEKYLNLTIKGFKLSQNDEKMIWCGICAFGYISSSKQKTKCPNCKKFSDYEASDMPENVIKCPGCSNGVLKENGCNFIQCGWPICNIYFCALCKTKLTQSQHYSHFKNTGPFGDTCNKLDKILD